MRYIAKSAAKPERRSQPYHETVRLLFSEEEDDAPAKRVIAQLITGTVEDRDYTIAESVHLLMGWICTAVPEISLFFPFTRIFGKSTR